MSGCVQAVPAPWWLMAIVWTLLGLGFVLPVVVVLWPRRGE